MLKHRIKKLEKEIIPAHQEQLPVKLIVLNPDESHEQALERCNIVNTDEYRKIIFICPV